MGRQCRPKLPENALPGENVALSPSVQKITHAVLIIVWTKGPNDSFTGYPQHDPYDFPGQVSYWGSHKDLGSRSPRK